MKVTEQMIVERYSHVMHIVSNVEGIIDPKYDAIAAKIEELTKTYLDDGRFVDRINNSKNETAIETINQANREKERSMEMEQSRGISMDR